jgi:hypothetical protein
VLLERLLLLRKQRAKQRKFEWILRASSVFSWGEFEFLVVARKLAELLRA